MRTPTLVALFAFAVACGKTSTQVRSGEAWADARPADYSASKDEVVRACESFLNARNFRVEYNADKSYLTCFKKADDLGEQSIEMHIKIEPSQAAGMTRVTAISGRSSGVVWKGRYTHERLHKHLNAAFSGR